MRRLLDILDIRATALSAGGVRGHDQRRRRRRRLDRGRAAVPMTGRTRRIVAALGLVLAVSAVVAWAFWSASGSGIGSATSATLGAASISAAAAGLDSVTVTWDVQASLQPAGPGNSAITYSVERKLGGGSWAALGVGGCSGAKPHGVTSCIDAPPATGSYSYRVVATYYTWTATSNEPGAVSVTVDTVAPANAITLSSITGGAFKNGATVYYRGSAAGSFRLTNAVSDSDSGPASSATAALSGGSTGWTHSPSLVSSPAGGPYVSGVFSWTAASSSSPSETVTGSDVAGNTAATALTFSADTVAPAGGPVDATGLVGTGSRYSTSTGLSIGFTAASDPGGSGVATGVQLLRASASLSGGACGSYGATTQVGADDPANPVADTGLTDQRCYSYQYVASDRVGNQAIYTSQDVKVDTTAPSTPSLAYSALTNAYRVGSTIYYRSNQSSGGFTVTAAATDAASGIASYALPTLPAGWTSAPGAAGVKTYSWSAPGPTAPSGAQNTTATNNAALTSPAAGFTATADVTPPATGSVSHTDGYHATSSLSVTLDRGSDGGSGVDAAYGVLERQDAPLNAGGACGTYGSFTVRGSNPASPFVDTGLLTGRCYRYQYSARDNLANPVTYAGTSVAKVDLTAPTVGLAAAAKAEGTSTAVVRQGGAYRIYALATDSVGVSTVTATVSTFDAVTATPLTTAGGPWTVGGQIYDYRSASLSANTGLTTGNSYSYTITATDVAGNATAPASRSATIQTYDSVIAGTAGLVSLWRFGDGAIVTDDFTDAAGTALPAHTGPIGATWTSIPSQAQTGVISTAGRLRKTTGTGSAQYYASGTPSNANYLVEADVHVASKLATDSVAVIGRQDVSGTGLTLSYLARYSVDTTRWELGKVVNGVLTLIGTGTGAGFYTQVLTVGASYRMTLQMNGSAISLLVDGVARVTAPADTSATAAGRSGARLGTGASTAAVSDTAGLHLDNFRTTSLATTAADSRGANTGTFTNGPRLNEGGALAGDTNRAALLDGLDDFVTIPHATSLNLADGPFTLEAWVKRSTASTAAFSIFNKGTGAVKFGFAANSTVLARDVTAIVTSTAPASTDLSWHHVAVTKNGNSTATQLYIDGAVRTGTVTNLALANTATALFLGAKGGTTEFLPATIDEFAVYNAVLAQATILDHYLAGNGTG